MKHFPFSRIISLSLTASFLAFQTSAEAQDALFAEVPQEQPASTTTTMLPLSAETISSFGFPEDNSPFSKDFALEEPQRKTIQFSLRGGIHDLKDALVDSSYGIQGEILYSVPNLPIDIDLRGYYSKVEYEPSYASGSAFENYGYFLYQRSVTAYCDNDEAEIFGGSAQIRFRFLNDSIITPYLAGGVAYEKTERTGDVYVRINDVYTGYWIGRRRYSSGYIEYIDAEDDGFTWIARLGLEGTLYPVYLRLELSAVGEIYDSDSVQAEILAMVGVNLTENLRFEIAGDYFTDWEEYYITAGLSVGF